MAIKVVRGNAATYQRSLPQPGSHKNVHCMPPATAAHGSAHLLQPPNGAPCMTFFWDAQSHRWIAAHRKAFPYHYLASHGWAYIGPMPVSA